MIPKLEVSHLCYSYHTMEGETEALSDLSFQENFWQWWGRRAVGNPHCCP